MEGIIANPDDMINVEPDKNQEWLWVAESEIEKWVKTREREVFLPLINYYMNRHQGDWEQGSVRPER